MSHDNTEEPKRAGYWCYTCEDLRGGVAPCYWCERHEAPMQQRIADLEATLVEMACADEDTKPSPRAQRVVLELMKGMLARAAP